MPPQEPSRAGTAQALRCKGRIARIPGPFPLASSILESHEWSVVCAIRNSPEAFASVLELKGSVSSEVCRP